MSERDDVLRQVPAHPPFTASGYIPEIVNALPNAKVFVHGGELWIYPVGGGVLVTKIENLTADIAPFHG